VAIAALDTARLFALAGSFKIHFKKFFRDAAAPAVEIKNYVRKRQGVS
jgi:hypothetical protein